jgi:plasmid stability protein
MATLIVRDLDEKLHARLKVEARRRGLSVNALSKLALRQAVERRHAPDVQGRYTDLDALAGTWSAAQARQIEAATRPFAEIDAELWR